MVVVVVVVGLVVLVVDVVDVVEVVDVVVAVVEVLVVLDVEVLVVRVVVVVLGSVFRTLYIRFFLVGTSEIKITHYGSLVRFIVTKDTEFDDFDACDIIIESPIERSSWRQPDRLHVFLCSLTINRLWFRCASSTTTCYCRCCMSYLSWKSHKKTSASGLQIILLRVT